ncbi:MAG: hypothetical protein KF847_20700 [Pirellulales bacterium]|nr:hypothetical protein [Pirellulales bacterium]
MSIRLLHPLLALLASVTRQELAVRPSVAPEDAAVSNARTIASIRQWSEFRASATVR